MRKNVSCSGSEEHEECFFKIEIHNRERNEADEVDLREKNRRNI